MCPNMFKISLDKLLSTLEHTGQVNRVEVPEAIGTDARMAHDCMLDLAHRRALPRKYETRLPGS